MITFISRHIALLFLNKNIIGEEKLPVCQYGVEMIISLIIGFLSVLLTGAIMEEALSAFVFYIVFIGIRIYTGGFHARSYLKCKITLVLCCISVLITLKYVSFSLNALILLSGIYVVTVVMLSPIEHPNAPLTEKEHQHNRIISIIMALVISVASICLYHIFAKLVTIIILTLFTIAVLMVIPIISRQEVN